jgi:hypothetical protein
MPQGKFSQSHTLSEKMLIMRELKDRMRLREDLLVNLEKDSRMQSFLKFQKAPILFKIGLSYQFSEELSTQLLEQRAALISVHSY